MTSKFSCLFLDHQFTGFEAVKYKFESGAWYVQTWKFHISKTYYNFMSCFDCK